MRRPPRDQLISGAGFPLARHTRLNTVLSRTLTLRGASVILAASEITSQQRVAKKVAHNFATATPVSQLLTARKNVVKLKQ